MELVKLGEKTYYLKNATNIGIYKLDDNNIYLIDSGNDKDTGKKILKIINEQGWNILGIINTHSHADHIGGNKFISERTNCQIFAQGIEKCFIKNTILEATFLYGGAPFKELQNKFLQASSSNAKEIVNFLPEGLQVISLKGHSFDMIGLITSDDICFIGDALFSKETISKYHIFFISDIKEFLNTLDYLENLRGKMFVPSHVEASNNIQDLIEYNRKKVHEIINKICSFCSTPQSFETILKYLFDTYNLTMNYNQYVLVGSTIKSYLSYLYNENKLKIIFKDNQMLWHFNLN